MERDFGLMSYFFNSHLASTKIYLRKHFGVSWKMAGVVWTACLKWTFQFLIGLYRSIITLQISAPCRFEPSCSSYAMEAFHVHHPLTAFRLTLRRLLRCHPFGGAGYDPVPLPTLILRELNE